MLEAPSSRRSAALVRSFLALTVAALLGVVASAQGVLAVNNGIPREPTSQLYFMVYAKSEDVKICGLSIYMKRHALDQSATAQVYEGPLGASETDPSGWTLSHSQPVEVSWAFTTEYLSLANPIVVPAGEFRRISVVGLTLEQELPAATLRIEEPILSGIVENDDLQVLSGMASASAVPFSGAPEPAQFFGFVHYSTGTQPCGEGSLPVEVLPSQMFDGPEPGGVGPLKAGKVYAITPGSFGWSEVPPGKKLTAEPGVIIKLDDGQSWSNRINVKGEIEFEGVTITSMYDDSIGGDTDGQLGLTSREPMPGDFESIAFESISSGSFDGGGIFYGGANPVLSTFSVNSSDVSASNLLFRDNAGPRATFDGKNRDGVELRDSLFEDNGGPPLIGVTFDSIDGFSGNAAQNNLGGDYMTITGSTTGCPGPAAAQITDDVVVNPANYPGDVLVVGGSNCVQPGASLTLDPGVNVKFAPGVGAALIAQPTGELNLIGTAAFPVTLTSLGDDSIGGDTDKNGVATDQPGDYRGVQFQSGSTGMVENADIRNAGDLGPALAVQSFGVTVRRFVVRDSGNVGVEVTSVNGDVDTFFVFDSALDGVRLPASDPDGEVPNVRHATILGSGGYGLWTPATSYEGTVVNTIVWDSTTGNFSSGFTADNVESSLGAFAGLNGNLDEDPGLVTKYSVAVPVPLSAVVDNGKPLPDLTTDYLAFDRSYSEGPVPKADMGAAEAAPVAMSATPFQEGKFVVLNTEAPGSAGMPVAYAIGTPGELYLPGIGLVGLNLVGYVTLGVGFVGQDFEFQIPAQTPGGVSLAGMQLSTQGIVIDGKLTPTNYAEGTVTTPVIVE